MSMSFGIMASMKCHGVWIEYAPTPAALADPKSVCPDPTPKTKAAEELTTDTVCGSYCGKWNTKKDAINSLFSHYRRTKGKNYRWYVNWEGYLEWFEVGSHGIVEQITDTDNRVITFNVSEDSSNIKNYLTGSYGEGDDSGTVTRQNATSIGIYGKCVDDSYTDTCMDLDEMTDYLERELEIKAVPVYDATVELAGFYLIEPGRQIQFPDDVYYGSLVWTVVDWSFSDENGKPVTRINLTTDESVISPANEFEIIQNIAAYEVAKSLPEAARVISIVGDSHLLVEKEADKSRAIVRSLTTEPI